MEKRTVENDVWRRRILIEMTSLRVDFRRRRERRVGDRRDRRGTIVEGGVFLCGAPARGVGKYPGPAGGEF